MQSQHPKLTGLLGAILLTSGLASSLVIADEPEAPASEAGEATPEAEEAGQEEEMVEVRISLPDGRTIIRREPARQRSARVDIEFAGSGSRTLPDGSRISTAGRAVSGGSNSSSVSIGGSSGGGGGGGASVGGGGGGGASSVSAGSSDGGEKSTLSGGGTAKSEGSGEMVATASPAHRGVFTVKNGSLGLDDAGAEAGGSGSTVPVAAGGSDTADAGSGDSSTPAEPVHTVGSPRYDDEGATGGQRVEFHDAGMSAAVIGDTVYFIGVELVSSSEPFSVVTGTRFGTDSVIMDDLRVSTGGSDPLSSFNTGASSIRLEFESDTVVDLVMQSRAENPADPVRVQRTWTVRIR